MSSDESDSNKNKTLKGTRGRVFLNNGTPAMKWTRVENRSKNQFPPKVINFCTEHVLPLVVDNHLIVRTKHHRHGVIFCASPCCLHDGGQDSSIWFNWAVLEIDDSLVTCQMLCFVRINSLQPGIDHIVQQCPIAKNNNCAAVQRMTAPPHKQNASNHVTCSKLSD